MYVSYDTFEDAFLQKITEYEFLQFEEEDREHLIDSYMKRSISAFAPICEYDLVGTADDEAREFKTDIAPKDVDELSEIVSEGMLVQWIKPYVFKQENLENVMTTRDFTVYSPSELLHRVSSVYDSARKNFANMMREYSYNHGDLTDLHL